MAGKVAWGRVMPRIADVISRSEFGLTWEYMKAGFYVAGLEGIGAGSLIQFVLCFLQVMQVRRSIYVYGAIRTAAAKVIPFTFI